MYKETKIIEDDVSVNVNDFYIKPLSWTAILVGALVAIGLSFLLNLFGLSVGLTVYPTSPEGFTVLSISGFIVLAIGVIISMFISGWVSGLLGRETSLNPNVGILYGFASWSLSLIFGIVFAVSLSLYVAIQYEAITNPSRIMFDLASKAENKITQKASRMKEALVESKPVQKLKEIKEEVVSSEPVQKMKEMKEEIATSEPMQDLKEMKNEALSEKTHEKYEKSNRNNNHSATPSKEVKKDQIENVQVENIGKSLFPVFLLFLMGAIASACGGYVGIKRSEMN